MGRLVRGVLLILAAVALSRAQDLSAVEQRAEGLRAQLRDVIDKESELQGRARQLDEALKPENIERSVAGIGTTDATALREQRRQQLEREKAGVEEQLQNLAASRSRLEASIANAEAEAVRLRAAALGANNAPRQTNATGTSATPSARKKRSTRRAHARRHRRARRESR